MPVIKLELSTDEVDNVLNALSCYVEYAPQDKKMQIIKLGALVSTIRDKQILDSILPNRRY